MAHGDPVTPAAQSGGCQLGRPRNRGSGVRVVREHVWCLLFVCRIGTVTRIITFNPSQ